MVDIYETPGTGVFSALDTERANHKQARRDAVKWREKYQDARRRADAWEFRANRATEKLETLQAQLDQTNR